MVIRNPWFFGALVFLVMQALGFWLAAKILGPIGCEDNWNSSSIGAQGACSHHGGVDRSRASFISLLSFSAAVWLGLRMNAYNNAEPFFRKAKIKLPHDDRPPSPYGNKSEHKILLLKSGMKEEIIDTFLNQYRDD